RRLPADLPFRIQHSTLGGPAVLRLLPRLYAAPGDVLQRPAGHRAVPPCNVSLRIALDGDNPGGDLSARLETPALSPFFFRGVSIRDTHDFRLSHRRSGAARRGCRGTGTRGCQTGGAVRYLTADHRSDGG